MTGNRSPSAARQGRVEVAIRVGIQHALGQAVDVDDYDAGSRGAGMELFDKVRPALAADQASAEQHDATSAGHGERFHELTRVSGGVGDRDSAFLAAKRLQRRPVERSDIAVVTSTGSGANTSRMESGYYAADYHVVSVATGLRLRAFADRQRCVWGSDSGCRRLARQASGCGGRRPRR